MPFSVAFWVQPSTTNVHIARIFGNREGLGGMAFQMNGVANSNTYYFWMYAGGTWTAREPYTDLNPGQWNHVVITLRTTSSGTAGTKRVYLNGVLVGTLDFTGTYAAPVSKTLTIGQNDNNDVRFAGAIDSFRIYSRELFAGEVWNLYQTNTAAFPTPPAQWLYYKFDESSGTTAADASGNGYHGTIVNGATHVQGPAGMCRALHFNGSVDQYLDTQNKLAQLQVPFTIAFWIKPGATQEQAAVNVLRAIALQSLSGLIFRAVNGLYFFRLFTESGFTTTLSFGLIPSVWQHVAIVVKSTATNGAGISTAGTIEVFLDGVQASVVSFTGVYHYGTTSKLLIGGIPDGNFYYTGALEEMQIISRALTDIEISAMAKMGEAWLYYEFELLGQASEETDLSGSCLNGDYENGMPGLNNGNSPGGKAAFFSSTTGWIDTKSRFADLTVPFSVSFWTNAYAFTQNANAELFGNHETPGHGMVFQMDNVVDSNNFQLSMGLGQSFTPAGPWVSLWANYAWSHVVLTVTATSYASGIPTAGKTDLYLNGVLQGSASFTGTYSPPALANMTIGRSINQGFYGILDSFRVHSRAVSPGEVWNLYQTNALAFPTPPAQWLYYKFDESSGTTAADASGNGYHGTTVNGATHVQGRMCRSLQFNGSVDQYVDTQNKLPQLQVPFTIALWVRHNTAQTNPAHILSATTIPVNETVSKGWALRLTESSLSFRMGTTGGEVACAFGGFTTQHWHHVAIVVESTNPSVSDAGRIRTLINGEESHQVAFNGIFKYDTNANVLLGKGFDGKFDEVQILSRALADSEMKSMALMGDMWVHYEFNEASGTTTEDLSGSCLPGQFVNGPTRVSELGNAVNLDGVSQSVDTQSLFGNLVMPFSVALWVNPSATNAVDAEIFGNRENATGGMSFRKDTSDNYLFTVGNSSGVPVTLTAGQWNHVVLTVFGDYVTVCVNGTSVENMQNLMTYTPPVSNTLTIGRSSNTNNYFAGAIDSFRIFSRGLSAGEAWDLKQSNAL